MYPSMVVKPARSITSSFKVWLQKGLTSRATFPAVVPPVPWPLPSRLRSSRRWGPYVVGGPSASASTPESLISGSSLSSSSAKMPVSSLALSMDDPPSGDSTPPAAALPAAALRDMAASDLGLRSSAPGWTFGAQHVGLITYGFEHADFSALVQKRASDDRPLWFGS